jgi:large subunit ribosomal protein L1
MTQKSSKRVKAFLDKIDATKKYALLEALTLAKNCATAKFDESVDIAVSLGLDSKKSDQNVRGATVLPEGTGKAVRVAVFAQGANAELAKKAGADIVGFEDLAEKIKAGEINFDVLVATPDAMRVVSPLGAVLGPRGLMPNPKTGTISPDVAQAVKNVKGGQVSYRTEKNGIVHVTIGKKNFTEEQLKKNFNALIADLKKLRPQTAKGVYLKKITLSTSMGPGIPIDIGSLEG